MDVADPSVRERPADPCVFVIFGAAGDLTRRKLLPSLYNLSRDGLLPHDFAVVGVSRETLSTDDFRKTFSASIREFAGAPIDDAVRADLEQHLTYVQGQVQDAAMYARLGETLAKIDREHETRGNYVFYLAMPPSLFDDIVRGLGKSGLAKEREDGTTGWRRLVVEKPFGHDLESARALNRAILRTFKEHQVYRIDHYLGKETVQNLLVFRFANGMLEPIWNRSYVDHVQITVAESIGVEGRGRYYEEAGLMRDMMQNHMFQLLALVAMEPCVSFESNAVRDEKVKVLHAIHPMKPEDVLGRTVRGQYGEGMLDGKKVPAYRSEPDVSPTSNTETYAAAKLAIDNWRWAGVPFYLRSGKRLPKRATEIVVQFRQAPLTLFRQTAVGRLQANQLALRIQPEEGIALSFEAKVPGPSVRTETVSMDFTYDKFFGCKPTTGYETLLYDVMTGDSMLFHRSDMVEAAWSIVMPILDVWKTLPARDFPNYSACRGWGPSDADELISRDGRHWRGP